MTARPSVGVTSADARAAVDAVATTTRAARALPYLAGRTPASPAGRSSTSPSQRFRPGAGRPNLRWAMTVRADPAPR
jgi:hypothetical protein